MFLRPIKLIVEKTTAGNQKRDGALKPPDTKNDNVIKDNKNKF
jgi:hypothetical protein